eukprot:6902541-Lingulodinium_polyedra.AAC.1
MQAAEGPAQGRRRRFLPRRAFANAHEHGDLSGDARRNKATRPSRGGARVAATPSQTEVARGFAVG